MAEITGTKISALPSVTTPTASDVLAGVQSNATKKFALSVLKTYFQNGVVPTTRRINNKLLSSDITLSASDVGAAVSGDLAPVESSSTASTNYAVGSYLVYNGILYSVTAAIASGETITPGTNVTAVTVVSITDALDTRVDALEDALDGLVSRLGAM